DSYARLERCLPIALTSRGALHIGSNSRCRVITFGSLQLPAWPPSSSLTATLIGPTWRSLHQRGHHVVLAAPDGKIARADPQMLTSGGLGICVHKRGRNGRSAYQR